MGFRQAGCGGPIGCGPSTLRRDFAADPLQVQQRAIADAICGWLKLGYGRHQKDRNVQSGRTRRP
jgi:hypothetical protein